jgi:hypothetical protein
MAKRSKKQNRGTPVYIKGFYRVQLVEDGKVVGDSGMRENLVVNLGFLDYLVKTLGKISGSKQIGYVALGTGGAPTATDTSLAGEIMGSTQRRAVVAASSGSKTLQLTATFASSDSFVTQTYNISNIGLFDTTNTNATLFAGNTYASSLLNTNQDVNITYNIQFS